MAFELAPNGLARIRRNLARNGALGRRVRVVEADVTTVVDPAQRADTLDHLSDQLALVPALLKIDVEGAELDVLRGSERLLGQRRLHVVVETHAPDVESGCVELMQHPTGTDRCAATSGAGCARGARTRTTAG